MHAKSPHLFDDATKVTAGDSCWQGKTSPDYWAFVGPFGGCTAATILRALIEHPQRAGDPLAMLQYTPATHAHAAKRLCALANELAGGRIMGFGGGGYNRANLAAAWCGVLDEFIKA